MRKILFVLFALLATVTWADENFRQARYDNFKVLSPSSDGIVMIGNSITDMHIWNEVFRDKNGNCLPISNRGNSGSYATQQSENLESYIAQKPKKVFMMIGTNDIATSGGLSTPSTPEVLLSYVKSIITRIHKRSPQTHVYLFPILKNSTTNRVEATWVAYNALLKSYVEGQNNALLTYIDIYDALACVADGGSWSNDKLHPNACAFKKWCDAMLPYMDEGTTCDYDILSSDLTSVQQQTGLSSMNGGRATMFSVMPIKSSDILFFGDGEIKTAEWWELLGNNNVKNRGTGWGYSGTIAVTSSVVDNTFATVSGITKACPKAVFLYTGTSDVATSTANVTTAETAYKTLVDKIFSYAADTKIYVMGIHPAMTTGPNTNITAFNTWLKETLPGNYDEGKVKYIDTYTGLVTSAGIANTTYIRSTNYLGGMGAAYFANQMAEAFNEDFPGEMNPISLSDAQTNYDMATRRNLVGTQITANRDLAASTTVGGFSQAAVDAYNAELEKAYTLLDQSSITDAEATAEVTAMKTALNSGLVLPTPSTDTEEYWYQFAALRSLDYFVSATGATSGVSGQNSAPKSAASMWKFVKRTDGSYDIINREYNGYLDPSATYNTQVKTTTTAPSAGWTLTPASSTGYFAIASGEAELNQTTSAHSYAVYNWSDSSKKGADLDDTGCQMKITEAPEPEEEATTVEYTIDKTTGTIYTSAGAAATSYGATWKSTATPQLTFGCGPNNMNWSSNTIQLFSGTAASATYTITAPTGYVIDKYSFTYTAATSTALTLTVDGTAHTTSQTAQQINQIGVNAQTASFTYAGTNGNGLLLTDFKVTIRKDGAVVAPEISTEGNEHWYYIINAASASTASYCSGKAIYWDASFGSMRFADKQFNANYVWSFWKNSEGKIAIKNYNGVYFGTAPTGTGDTSRLGKSDTPNYIYSINSNYGAFTIEDGGTAPLHAQNSNSVIVRWAAAEGNASLWTFSEVDCSEPEAKFTGATVKQGKVTAGIGNKNSAVLRSTIHIAGLTGTVKLTRVNVKLTNKDNIDSVKVFFANNAQELFVNPEGKMPWRTPNGTLFGKTKVGNYASFGVTGDTTLAPGDYYLWIACDIKDDETLEGNTFRADINGYTFDTKYTALAGACTNDVTIFLSEGTALMPRDMGTTYYRIPAITQVQKNGHTRLVVLTDDRKEHNSDLPSHCYVVGQYSDDLGKTWSEPVTVAGTATTGGDYGHGDASLVTNRDNGEIIGIMTSSKYGTGFWASTPDKPQTWKTVKSTDGGETWEEPVDHTTELYGTGSPNPTVKGGFSGSGAALQLRDGTLVSSFVNRDANDVRNFMLIESDDDGNTWHFVGTSGTTSADEPKSLERNNGDIAISVRASGYNYHNVTSNHGTTWKNAAETRFTSGITGNACDGEYMVWSSTKDGNPWNIAFQTGPYNGSRQNLSIAISKDEGETFGTPKTICPWGSAYSAAVVLPDGTLGVYYEESGIYGGYTLRFVRFSMKWATGDDTYVFTEHQPFHMIQSTRPTAINAVAGSNGSNGSNGKYLKDSQLVIVNNGITYTATGVKLN